MTTLPRTIAVGERPRTSAFALLAALATAIFLVSLRFLDHTTLLGLEPSLATAALGGCFAGLVGRYRGGVLAGVLAAALPVFAVDAATTAVHEPVTLDLATRAITRAAWYTTGVAVLLVGPFGYALGVLSRHDWDPTDTVRSAGSGRSLREVDHEQRRILLAWVAVAIGASTVASITPAWIPPSPTAASPVPVAAGLVVATELGRRAPHAVAPALAGWAGVATGLHFFTQNFITATNALTPVDASTILLTVGLGALAGIPLGLTGYVLGRTIAD